MACFKEERDPDFDRYDYAIICNNEKRDILAYATILEHDARSAYMQHGGTFSTNGLITVKSYMLIIDWLKKKYPILTTRIFNTNVPMLKLALQAGFLIHGVEYYPDNNNFKGGVLLCLHMESDYFKEAMT